MGYIESFINDLGGNILTIFAAFLAIKEMLSIIDWITRRFGIQTKWSILANKEKEMLLQHDIQMKAIATDIKDIKITSAEDAKATRDKINVLSQMILELQQILDTMEDRRINARRETLKQQLYNLYYKYRERAEQTGKMTLSKCEYDQFWTAFKEYESPPLNGDGLIHSIVEVYMLGFSCEGE